MKPFSEEISDRARRFALFRAAQLTLAEVLEPIGALEPEAEEVRKLLERLREQRPEGEALEAALADVDAQLDGFRASFHATLGRAPVHALCAALRRAGDDDPASLRALGVVLLESGIGNEATLRLVEGVATSLACEGPRDARSVARSPLDALPELASLAVDVEEQEVEQALGIFSRAVERLYEDDPEATRNRLRSYKERLGIKLLHPRVLEGAVAYNAAMGNRMSELAAQHPRRGDELAETLLGREGDGTGARAVSAASAFAEPRRQALQSRLLWSSVSMLVLAIASMVAAAVLWPSLHERNPGLVTASDSPYLAGGYFARSDEGPRFVATVSPLWFGIGLTERERVVRGVAERIGEIGVYELVLVDAHSDLQARHDGEELLWVRPPPGGLP